MVDIASRIPFELSAGNTWQWNIAGLTSDYPADSWTLTYYFKSKGDSFEIVAIADGLAFAISAASSVTADFMPGVYNFRAFVELGVDRFEIDTGWLTVNPDYTKQSNFDARSHARKVLDAIEKVIEGRATKDQQQYSIAGRQLIKTAIPDLLLLRQTYRRDVENENKTARIAAGLSAGNRILMRG